MALGWCQAASSCPGSASLGSPRVCVVAYKSTVAVITVVVAVIVAVEVAVAVAVVVAEPRSSSGSSSSGNSINQYQQY